MRYHEGGLSILMRFSILTVVFFLLASFGVDNFTETKGDTPVLMKKKVKQKLTEAYEGREKEKPFCLFGSRDRINRISAPKVISSTDTMATWKTDRCESKRDFLGYVHNHKKENYPSQRDEFRFVLNKDSKVEIIAYQNSGEVSFHSYFYE